MPTVILIDLYVSSYAIVKTSLGLVPRLPIVPIEVVPRNHLNQGHTYDHLLLLKLENQQHNPIGSVHRVKKDQNVQWQ